MTPKIFLTGGTGYIGGSVLHTLATNKPEWDITVLFRNTPLDFFFCYPFVKVIQGDYDSFDILSKAASEADVVVHCGDSDHEPSLKALIDGLLKRPSSKPPGFLIHLSGTGIVSDWSSPDHLGKRNPKVWSDTDAPDLSTIASLPDGALHRNTEKILGDAIARHADRLNVAVVCPPDVYGRGFGPGRTSSVFVAMFVDEVLNLGRKDAGDERKGRPFYVGDGANTRSWVHISDLTCVYLKLVEAAAERGGKGATWGKDGYYFAASQEHSHLDVARAIGRILRDERVIANAEPLQIELERLDEMQPMPRFPQLARYMFASNSRTRADRAKKLFGYCPKEKGLLQCLEDDVVAEIDRRKKQQQQNGVK